jgi:hypothetical protein
MWIAKDRTPVHKSYNIISRRANRWEEEQLHFRYST